MCATNWILLSAILILIVYVIYQSFRSSAVFFIRITWGLNNNHKSDFKLLRYSANYMFWPKLNNWFGLKFPREKDYV